MERSLTQKMVLRLLVGLVGALVLVTPLLYIITTHFYAEDLIEIVHKHGIAHPHIDLMKDVMAGVMIQLGVMVSGIVVVVLIVVQILKPLWRPFYATLAKVSQFDVEKGAVALPERTGTREFSALNTTLNHLMQANSERYHLQKEFTENASHELQTPLAIVLNKMDNLVQGEALTAEQASQLQEMYQELHHMSRLSRNLLLLSKIANAQFRAETRVNLCDLLTRLLPRLESVAADIEIRTEWEQPDLQLRCNATLLESLITNLVVNAVRHNYTGGTITLRVTHHQLRIANTSHEPALDAHHLFERFYRSTDTQKGNGLGLAIVKSICDYHHWHIAYAYAEGQHAFVVDFKK